MGMEPKSPQGGNIPIWIGGNTAPAFQRIGTLGDGWLANQVADAEQAKRCMDAIREAAAAAGRDPEALGWQSSIASPPRPGDNAARIHQSQFSMLHLVNAAEFHLYLVGLVLLHSVKYQFEPDLVELGRMDCS